MSELAGASGGGSDVEECGEFELTRGGSGSGGDSTSGMYDESCYWLSVSADPLHAMRSVYLVEHDIWVLCTSTDRSLPLSNGRTGKSSLRPSTYNRLAVTRCEVGVPSRPAVVDGP